jgi:membrane protease YdiL (CAAX protease family)
VLLLRDPDFDRGRLRRVAGVGRESIRVLMVFVLLGGLLTAATAVLSPETWLNLLRSRPVLWAVIMVAYPLLSVYPQELIWRAFFFHRYRLLFPGRWAMILASSLAFGYVHVLFLSPLAVVLTVVGGVLFAWTYERTGSILASSIEHALYGCLIFTIGLGEHFYAGPYVG